MTQHPPIGMFVRHRNVDRRTIYRVIGDDHNQYNSIRIKYSFGHLGVMEYGEYSNGWNALVENLSYAYPECLAIPEGA